MLEPRYSFCLRPKSKTKALVANGSKDKFICDRCVTTLQREYNTNVKSSK